MSAAVTSYGARPRPAGGKELALWVFMRVSGVVLLVLALGHWFIMHVFNSVHVIDYDFVAARYLKMFWRLYDLTMLWLAMIHGLNGLRVILDDYLKPPANLCAMKVLYLVGVIFLLLGTYAILAFQPQLGKVM